MRWLVTGGAGFIGSAFIRYGLTQVPDCASIINLDKLTYAADLRRLRAIEDDPRYQWVEGDIADTQLVEKLCQRGQVDGIVHFAAESHVDRSIVDPLAFYHTNVGGTLALLEVVRRHPHLHFHQVSTDEVFGSLESTGIFSEDSPYRPNSPYAASKAAADHFVRAYAHTYGLSVTLSHCTNNYGPGQHEEKLIPRMIACCQRKEPLPIYGDGLHIRDWLFVDDHADAVWKILLRRAMGGTWAIGGRSEKTNRDVVRALITLFAAQRKEDPEIYRSLVVSAPDRPGHDFRYAMDPTKMYDQLGWEPRYTFEEGLSKTIAWYEEAL